MGGSILRPWNVMCLKLFLVTVLPNVSFYILYIFYMVIDVNQMDDDVMQEHVAPDNEKAREMLDRICQEEMGISAQELYLRWIIREIKSLQDAKDAGSKEKLLKYLKEIDNICWFSKDKRDVQITTKLRSASDIFNSTNIN